MKYFINNNKFSKIFNLYMDKYNGGKEFFTKDYNGDLYFYQDENQHPIFTYDFKLITRDNGKVFLVLNDSFSDNLYGMFDKAGYEEFKNWFQNKYKIKVNDILY